MAPNRPTRVQVQERLKNNFQALCERCPQLGKNQVTLDDSLTSLQWLSNLNVSINNPIGQTGKSGTLPRNGGLLPLFPRKLNSSLDCNSVVLTTDSPQASCSPIKVEFGGKELNFHPTKLSSYVGNGSSRALSRNGRKASAPAIERPSLRASDRSSERTYSFSAGSLKIHQRAMSNPEQNHHQQITRIPVKIKSTAASSRILEVNANETKRSESSNFKSTSQQTGALPQIDSLNHKLQDNDGALLSKETSCHYSFSPREATLDLLPGQVDYKNNPYVKPAFSFTTLICMALQSNKRHRMAFPSICKWITDNFMYYRYTDLEWQDAVKLNLTQSKYFSKVNKKKDSSSKSCLWEINRSCNFKLRDVNSPVQSGTPTRNSPRLGPLSNQISPASSIAITNLQSLVKLDPEDALALAGRKRKQTTPQKVVSRRGANAKKRRSNTKSTDNRNLLQEEAPQLGSLKGDFNWNSIFDEVFGTPEPELSATPSLISSRPSTNDGQGNHDTTGRISDEILSGSFLTEDMLSLPDVQEPAVGDENHITVSSSAESTENPPSWLSFTSCHSNSTIKNSQIDMSKSNTFSRKLPDINVEDFISGNKDEEIDSINGFLKDVGDLDLTITGRQIEPPPKWVPVYQELDAILCEKQNDNLFETVNSPTNGTYDIFTESASLQNNPNQCLHLQKSSSRERKAVTSGGNLQRLSNSFLDLGSSSQHPQKSWEEIKDATETIESLLSSTFHCNKV